MKTPIRLALVAAMATSLMGVSAPVVAAEPLPYTLTTLAPLAQGNQSWSNGINDADTAVGTSRTTTTLRPQLGSRWAAGAAPTLLPSVTDSTFARAFDINAGGVSVGELFTPSPEISKPALWTAAGELKVLPSLNEAGAGVAQDINDSGKVVGSSSNGTQGRAWLGGIDGIQALPLVADAVGEITSTRANAISNNDRVVGTTGVKHAHDDHFHTISSATVWEESGAKPLPGTVEDKPSSALGISNNGTIAAGEEADANGYHAMIWKRDPHGAWTAATLPGLEQKFARATAVNDAGTAVGWSSGVSGNPSFNGRAVMWSKGVAVDLNTEVTLPEGTVLRSATDINAKGTITGFLTNAQGTFGYVLTPRPAPAPAPQPGPGVVLPPKAATQASAHVSIAVKRNRARKRTIHVRVDGLGNATCRSVVVKVDRRRALARQLNGADAWSRTLRLKRGKHRIVATYQGCAGDRMVTGATAQLRFRVR